MAKYGNITCECGQEFYFETLFDSVDCIRCGLNHNVVNFPDVTEVIEVPVEMQKEMEE